MRWLPGRGIRKEWPIFSIIFLFIILKLFFLSPNVWWDSAVYLGMGKFIWSLGNSGLWEASRPLVWPTILGFFWKIGLDIIVVGRILSLLCAAGCIYLTYLIAKEAFDNKIGIIAALLIAFSPTFFFNSDLMLTGIPSTLFGLLAVYSFIRKRYFAAGLFSGLTFMTRFLGLLVVFGIGIAAIIYRKKLKLCKDDLLLAGLGLLVPVFPYLVLNFFMYKDILKPFLLQVVLTKYTGWMWWEPFTFYFKNLFKENFLVVLSLLGIYLLFIKKHRDYKKLAVLLTFLTFFIFYNFNIHKEMRFAITFMPYLYILASLGLVYCSKFIKNKKALLLISVLIVGVWCYETFSQYEKEEKITTFDPFIEFVSHANGTIWISNPSFIAYSDVLAQERIYEYQTSFKGFRILIDKLNEADNILLNTCDIPCFPGNDFCEEGKKRFMESVKNNFDAAYSWNFWDCELYIFRKRG